MEWVNIPHGTLGLRPLEPLTLEEATAHLLAGRTIRCSVGSLYGCVFRWVLRPEETLEYRDTIRAPHRDWFEWMEATPEEVKSFMQERRHYQWVLA